MGCGISKERGKGVVTVQNTNKQNTTHSLSEFEKFMAKLKAKYPDQEKPPREELMKLAKTLCQEAYPQVISTQTSDATPNKLEATSDTICRVSWDGISPTWFQNVFVKTPEVQRFMQYGCPMWFLREFGMLEILQRRGRISSGPAIDYLDVFGTDKIGPTKRVSKATAFVSFTGSYTIEFFTNLLAHEDLADKYVWIDTFCVDQFAWTSPRKTPEMKQFKTNFLYELATQVSNIGYTALLLNKWDDLMKTKASTLNQIWVLLEIFVTADSNATLRLLFSPEEHDRFIREGIENKGSGDWNLGRSLADIDVNHAVSELLEDKHIILQFMREQNGGDVSKVNHDVCKTLRNWMTTAAYYHLRKCREEKKAHLHVADNLAILLSAQGLYKEAEPLYREALSGKRATLGDLHPSTLGSINNLASLLKDQGLYKEAEPLNREAMAGMRATLGDLHPSTLNSINNLALLLKDQGLYKVAEPLHREAWAGMRATLGDLHPSTLGSINNLASLLSSQGLYKEAEPLYREALAGNRATLGDLHPSILYSINNLAVLFHKQGLYKEAEPLYREAMAGNRATQGDLHPSTLDSINNLALLLSDQGLYKEAEPLHREALAGNRATLGDLHPSTLGSINNLASLLNKQGLYKEAELLYREALAGRRATLGDLHPSTLASINNLADLLSDQGLYKEAELLCGEAVVGFRKILGDNHPHTKIAQETFSKVKGELASLVDKDHGEPLSNGINSNIA